MHSYAYKLLLVLLCLHGSLATDFYITSPYSAISWKAGEQARITWDLIQGGVDVNAIDVELLDGDSNNAKVIGVIASGLPADVRSIAWTVPADFQRTDSAFVRVRGKGPSGIVDRYSHRFAVQDDPAPPAPEKNTPPKVESKEQPKVIFNQQQVTTSSTTSATSAASTTSTNSATTSESSSSVSESTTETSSTQTSKTQTTTRTNNAQTLSGSYYLVSFIIAIVYLVY